MSSRTDADNFCLVTLALVEYFRMGLLLVLENRA